jgi:hypothetical protein
MPLLMGVDKYFMSLTLISFEFRKVLISDAKPVGVEFENDFTDDCIFNFV